MVCCNISNKSKYMDYQQPVSNNETQKNGKTKPIIIGILIVLILFLASIFFWRNQLLELVGVTNREKAGSLSGDLLDNQSPAPQTVRAEIRKLAEIPAGFEIPNNGFVFNNDGSKVAYSLVEKEKEMEYNPVQKLFINSEKISDNCTGVSARYSDTCSFAFSPDGKKFAYLILENDKYFVVIDGQNSPPYDWAGALAFSPDGRLAFIGKLEGKFYAIIDGQKSNGYDFIGEIFFSSGGQRNAFLARDEKKEFFVIDGIEQKKFYSIPVGSGGPYFAFSPDGKRFTYLAGFDYNPDHDKIIVDGREYDFNWGPVGFSQDNRYLYSGRDPLALDLENSQEIKVPKEDDLYEIKTDETGKEYIVLNGQRGKSYDKIGSVVLAPDKKSVAYWAGEKTADGRYRGFPVFKNVEFRDLISDDISYHDFMISPDGKTFLYTYSIYKGDGENNIYYLVANGQKYGDYKGDNSIKNLHFKNDGKIEYGARQDNGLIWVTLESL